MDNSKTFEVTDDPLNLKIDGAGLIELKPRKKILEFKKQLASSTESLAVSSERTADASRLNSFSNIVSN